MILHKIIEITNNYDDFRNKSLKTLKDVFAMWPLQNIDIQYYNAPLKIAGKIQDRNVLECTARKELLPNYYVTANTSRRCLQKQV